MRHDRTVMDCIVIGAGHNGLVTAAYLARAGHSVLVLEANDRVGGAAISAELFPGMGARLSKYSYLVSLLPQTIARDLDIDVPLARRRVASYTPDPADPRRGLLIPSEGADEIARRITEFTGDPAQAAAWRDFYRRTESVAAAVFPTLIEPLKSREEIKEKLDPDDWHDFFERPLGEVLERTFTDDVLRGVVFTDGLIGTFADAHDPSLNQNICFLYHVIGQGTGQWDVPIGGMGAITSQLADRVRAAGGQIKTSAQVTAVHDDGSQVLVSVREGDHESTYAARTVAANCAPAVLAGLQGREPEPISMLEAGAQVKVNMLLARLPRLRDSSVDPADAFRGTFHVNEGYQQLADAYSSAAQGEFPAPLPAEIYCHSLSDVSILSAELQAAGAHTLTLFGLHTPHSLFSTNDGYDNTRVLAAVHSTLDSVLAEPIVDCLMVDAHGNPCIEINTTVDLQNDLHIPSGNIFHTPLVWPWANHSQRNRTGWPVGSWGVETDSPRIAICGSGAARGGGVSGIPGHNAASYVTTVLSTA